MLTDSDLDYVALGLVRFNGTIGQVWLDRTAPMLAKKVYRSFINLTLGQFLFKCLISAARRLIYFRIFRIIILHLADVDPAYLAEIPGFAGRYLDRESIRKLADNPIYNLPDSFLDQAFGNGDKCYAFMQDNVLASYGWYSDKPHMINDQLQFHYDNTYIYMHRGFTLPKFRGQRLHAFGLAAALKDHQKRGYKGILSIVEAQNYNSLRSVYRLHFKTFGTIFVIRLFGRYFIRASKGCEKHSCTITVLEI